ncbi:hypothetical protein BCD48_24430 [Pseudofrankia sp. BMG5.36]|nr:hypothetical protein BCD48_24430 [Pseudofrankia sp. BMG5.36]
MAELPPHDTLSPDRTEKYGLIQEEVAFRWRVTMQNLFLTVHAELYKIAYIPRVGRLFENNGNNDSSIFLGLE